MLLLFNNLREKRILESQDGQNFGNPCYLQFAVLLQLSTRVPRKMHSVSANQMRIIFFMYYNLKSDAENNLHARAGAWSNGVIVSFLFCILLFPLFKIETIVIAWEAFRTNKLFPTSPL